MCNSSFLLLISVGINTEKKRKIVEKLLPNMPPRKKIFWNELPTNDSIPDLNYAAAEELN